MFGQGPLEDRAGAMSPYRANVQARRSIDVDWASVDRVAYQAVCGLTMGCIAMGCIAALCIATVPLGLFMTGFTLLAWLRSSVMTTPTRCAMLGLPVHVR
jgi:hypothetical protein